MKTPAFLHRFSWIIPLCIFTFLLVLGANMHPLWGDEAETALFGRSILLHGVPYGWDGVNLMGYHNGLYLDSNLINHSNPWLQYYLAAFSFFLFKESDFSTRLPFFFLSAASFPVAYLVALAITKSKRIALFSLVVLSISVPYLLFAHQAHHYPLTIFFGLLFLYSSLQLLTKSIFPKILFVISGALYLYSHYVSFSIFFISVFLVFTTDFFIRKKWREGKKFAVWYLGLSLASWGLFLPWALFFHPLENRSVASQVSFFTLLQQIPGLFYEGARYFNHNNAFPILFIPLAICVAFFEWRRSQAVRPLFLLTGLAVVYLLIVGLLQGVFTTEPPTSVRHNMILFPLLVIASCVVLDAIYRVNKVIFVIVFIIYALSTTFTLSSPRILLIEYAQELLNPYDTGDILVAEHINRFGRDGQTVFVNLERDHEALQFYVRKKVRFINRVRKNNSVLFPKNTTILPKYLYSFRGKPDWVVLFSKRPYDGSYYTYDMRPLPPGIDLQKDYEETVVPVFFSDTTRPEIEIHSFRQIRPEWYDQIFIYKLKHGTNSAF